MKLSQRRKARSMLVQALYQWQLTKTDIGVIEAEFFADNAMEKVDIEFFRDVLHGIPAKVVDLDQCFALFLDRTQGELDPVSLAVLRIGTYELLYRIDVPYKVAINEAVNLAKSYGPSEAHRYINGVLDKVAVRSRQAEMRSARTSP